MNINFNNLEVSEKDFNLKLQQKIDKKIGEVLEKTVKEIEKEEDYKGIIEDIVVKDLSVSFGFQVKGEEDLQVLTVDHHEGLNEVLTWNVDLFEEQESNNKEESKFTEYEVGLMTADKTPQEFETVASIFSDSELDEVDTTDAGDMQRVKYVTKSGDPDTVYRYYQKGRLIKEIIA